ncbi:MAG: hypothetical protein HFF14_11915 [Angelakisella sp.]|jgi:hypothetical protein|nr:hypothetical protein [Angelakisella sp.]
MDSHRRRFLLDCDQRGLCPAVAAAGARPVVLVSLPGGLYDDAWVLAGEEILREAKKGLPQGAEVCAALPAGGFWMEPYGELPFAQGAAHYAAAAKKAAAWGADSVLIQRARTLLQARAGVLGAREAGLPVYVMLEITGEGEGLGGGGDILAAFITLQELGVAALGLCSPVTGVILEALEEVAPCCRVPLMAVTRDLTGELPVPETRALFASRTARLAALGADWQGILEAGAPEVEAAVAALLEEPVPAIRRVDYRGEEEIWAAGEKQVFYLDGGIEFSDPILCQSDMADEIIQLEHQGEEAICIQPETADDGYNISLNNANLTMLPVVFLSDDEEALDNALFYYNGRAMVDSRSLIPEERLEEIAGRYGAVVV